MNKYLELEIKTQSLRGGFEEKKEQKEDKRAGDEDDNNDKNEDVKIMTVKEVLSKDKKNLIANEE